MNRSYIPQHRRRAFLRFIGRKIKEHRIISGFLAWLIASLVDGFRGSLVDLNNWLAMPFRWMVEWEPTNQFLDWVEYALLLLLYLTIIFSVWNLMRKVFGLRLIEPIYPKLLYEDELAAAAHAVDYQEEVGEEQVRERVEDLMYSIGEAVATALGITSKYYRAYFVVGSEDGTAISGFRWDVNFS